MKDYRPFIIFVLLSVIVAGAFYIFTYEDRASNDRLSEIVNSSTDNLVETSSRACIQRDIHVAGANIVKELERLNNGTGSDKELLESLEVFIFVAERKGTLNTSEEILIMWAHEVAGNGASVLKGDSYASITRDDLIEEGNKIFRQYTFCK